MTWFISSCSTMMFIFISRVFIPLIQYGRKKEYTGSK